MDDIHPAPDAELRRLPGLFRRWELARVVDAGKVYHIEDGGSADDGTPLLAIYVGLPVPILAEVSADGSPGQGSEPGNR